MCFSNAVPWSSALCAHCSSERSGKWKHSIGNQPAQRCERATDQRVVASREPDLGVRRGG